MKREQIADIAARYYPLPIKSRKDIIKMDDWCDKFADEIMALPLDVPSDVLKDELMKYELYHQNDYASAEKWIDEYLIKRNVK